jgi:hypothetical protein
VPDRGWPSFGGFGDIFRPGAATHRERQADRKPSSTPQRKERRTGISAPADERGPATAPKGQGGSPGAEPLRGKRNPKAPPASTAPSQPAPVPSQPAPVNTDTNAGATPVAPGKAKGNGKGRGLGHSLPTPRKPAQPPPQAGGRPDPPALGHTGPAAPNGNGKANGHSK